MKRIDRQVVINGKPSIELLSKIEAEIFFAEILRYITEEQLLTNEQLSK